MSSKNYKLYREHKQEIFEMICEVNDNKPFRPLWGFDTQEEENQYIEKLNEYLESKKPEIINRLKEMGFEPQ